MSTLSSPRSTVGRAPSHSPPDTLYAPGLSVSHKMGWFSIGLGVAELLLNRQLARATGMSPTTLQIFGVREIVCGVGILSSRRPIGWMWARVAGDALDLAALGSAYAEGTDEQRTGAAVAMAAVAAATAVDLANASALTAAAALEG